MIKYETILDFRLPIIENRHAADKFDMKPFWIFD